MVFPCKSLKLQIVNIPIKRSFASPKLNLPTSQSFFRNNSYFVTLASSCFRVSTRYDSDACVLWRLNCNANSSLQFTVAFQQLSKLHLITINTNILYNIYYILHTILYTIPYSRYRYLAILKLIVRFNGNLKLELKNLKLLKLL